MITNPQTGTNVHEIADGIYRINTPIDFPDGQGVQLQPVPGRSTTSRCCSTPARAGCSRW